MSLGLVLSATLALSVAVVVLVLPGFAVRRGYRTVARDRRGARPPNDRGLPADEPRAAALILALALSLCFITVVGGALLAFGVFSPTRLAVLTGVAAVVGFDPFLRWCSVSPKRLVGHSMLIIALATPLTLSLFGGGFRPAHSYQWFYWTLGRQLSIAQGIPDYVMEWGGAVRWQPDYLNFNIIGQAYLGYMHVVGDATAVAVWRLPLTLTVLTMTFLVFRLWFSFLPAVVAAAILTATNLYIDKLGNNSPEALGMAFGLVSVWLIVHAIRLGKRAWAILALVTIALTVSIHAIAATIFGLLLASAAIVELLQIKKTAWTRIPELLAGAVTGWLVMSALGLSLQGRASPLGDAKHPARINGIDPTYEFIQYSNGNFTTPVDNNSLTGLITAPWPGVDLSSIRWSWVIVLAAAGLIGAMVMRLGDALRATATALLFAVMLGSAVAWFQWRYDTYVPQHTGNARIAQYVPIVYALLLASGIQVLTEVFERSLGRHLGTRLKSGVTTVAVGIVVIALAPATVNVMAARPALSATGVAALSELKTAAPAGAVAVSNAATRGTVEFFSGIENPLEGRQPLIEDLSTLTSATAYLRRMHDFLTDPDPGELRQSLGATWLILAVNSDDLGTGLSYGGPARNFPQRADLEVVWRKDGVRLLHESGTARSVESVGPAQTLWRRYLISILVLSLLLATMSLIASRRGARVHLDSSEEGASPR